MKKLTGPQCKVLQAVADGKVVRLCWSLDGRRPVTAVDARVLGRLVEANLARYTTRNVTLADGEDGQFVLTDAGRAALDA